jgi:hypothetical protein
MKQFNNLIIALTTLMVVSCSTERHNQFTKIRVDKNKEITSTNLKNRIKNTENNFSKDFNKNNPSQLESSISQSKANTEIITSSSDQSYILPISNTIDIHKSTTTNNYPQKADSKFKKTESRHTSVPKKQQSSSGDGINTFALVGFLSGIAGLIVLPLLFGIIGIIFSAIGMSQILKGKGKGLGFAIAGLALGVIEIILIFVLLSILL